MALSQEKLDRKLYELRGEYMFLYDLAAQRGYSNPAYQANELLKRACKLLLENGFDPDEVVDYVAERWGIDGKEQCE